MAKIRTTKTYGKVHPEIFEYEPPVDLNPPDCPTLASPTEGSEVGIDSVLVAATTTTVPPVTGVTFYYRVVGDESFTQLAGVNDGEIEGTTTWIGTPSVSLDNSASYEYYATATNADGTSSGCEAGLVTFTTAAPLPLIGALGYSAGVNTGTTVYNQSDFFVGRVGFVLPPEATLTRFIGQMAIDPGPKTIWINRNDGTGTRGPIDGLIPRGNVKGPPYDATDGATALVTSGYTLIDSQLTWAAIEVLDPAMKYILVSSSTGASSGTSFNFNNVIAAQGGFSLSSGRLVMPSGVSAVQARGACYFSVTATTQARSARIRVNGSFVNGSPQQNFGFPVVDTTPLAASIVSAPLRLSPGDTIQFDRQLVSGDTTAADTTGSSTWFCAEEVDDNYVFMTKDATQVVTSGVTTQITYQVQEWDPLNAWDSGANGVRVPAGYNQAKVCFNYVIGNNDLTTGAYGLAMLNGESVPGLPWQSSSGYTGIGNGEGAWIDVEEGDLFTMHCRHEAGSNRDAIASFGQWFVVRFRQVDRGA